MIISSYLRSIGYIPRCIVHVGAHQGQEASDYLALEPQKIVWVEADPEKTAVLRALVAQSPRAERQIVLEGLVADADGEQCPFYCFSNDGLSSSLFRATALLGERWPTVIETGEVKELVTKRLDTLLAAADLPPEEVDILVFDVQGAELLALAGAGHYLANARFVEVEVSLQSIYDGAPLYDDVRAFLAAAGFEPVTEIPWHGDVVFARRETPAGDLEEFGF
jgi:FkbM family methyltransferase